MSKKFYITAAIPYVNAPPHAGHTLEFVQADVLARYHQLLKNEVLYVSGADENAQKNVASAKKRNISPKKWCNINSQKFKSLKNLLNLTSNFIFQRSSEKKHYKSSQKLWNLCKKGDIYKKKYTGLYCLGCEEFKKRKDLVNGRCPEHPNKKLEKISEENYFFRLSNYQEFLEKLIQSNKLQIIPKKRKNEALSFIKSGLEDFSISRSSERMQGWGIPVPNDPIQTMYVWFDALNVYQTAIGFGWNMEKYKKWWPADIHCIGKGILRFHAIYWPAILKSAGLKLPKKIFVHGYITVEGQKISKSLGNVIDPKDIVKKYGTDALRYFLLKTIHPHNDGDFNWKLFNKVYNADLANGLGNLVQRLSKLCQIANLSGQKNTQPDIPNQYQQYLNKFQFNTCLQWLWQKITKIDKFIDKNKLWEKNGDDLKKALRPQIKQILQISYLLKPFLPQTSEKIKKIFTAKNISAPKKPLFPRI